jgi:hypothetical protein
MTKTQKYFFNSLFSLALCQAMPSAYAQEVAAEAKETIADKAEDAAKAVAPTVIPTAIPGVNTQPFSLCDGYGAPSRKADGMTESTWMFGLAKRSADIRQNEKVKSGGTGSTSCKQALESPLLLPEFWLRRAHLLQARAVHLVADEKYEDALAALKESDALGQDKNDAFFADTVAIGNRAVRALTLIKQNKRTEAEREIEALSKMRPYSKTVQELAFQLGMAIDPSYDRHIKLLNQSAPLNPAVFGLIFYLHLGSGRYAEATTAALNVSFDVPKSRGGWQLQGDGGGFDDLRRRTYFAGAQAYALAATGKEAEADKVIATAKALIDEAAAPPVAEPGKKVSKSAMRAHETMKRIAAIANRDLERWDGAVLLRKQAPDMPEGEFFKRMFELNIRDLPVTADLLQKVTADNADIEAKKNEAVKSIKDNFEKFRLDEFNFKIDTFFQRLPRPETLASQPRFKGAGDGYFLSDNGFSKKKQDDGPGMTVRYTHNIATPSTVEELALLAAAKYAEKEGKDSVLLLNQRTITRTMNTMMYGRVINSQAAGHEAQLLTVFVDSNAVPADYANARWRLIPVKSILDTLQKKYATPLPQTTAKK